MKTKSLLTTLLLIVGLGSYTVLNTSYSGGFPSYQGNCNCHGGANSATTVTVNGLPSFYAAGQIYPITVTVSNSTQPFAGFQIQTNVGTLTTTDPGVTIQGGALSAGHNSRKAIISGTATFSLTWTAPTPGGAAVNFNAVGNAVNGSGTGGDAWNAAATTNLALPVKFTKLSALQNDQQIDISFEAIDYQNVKHFEVEKSFDGISFNTISTLEPRATNQYAATDFETTLNKTHFYRIKEVSVDGAIFYSEVAAVNFVTDKNVIVYPTEIYDNTLNISGVDLQENNTLIVSDFLGRKVLQQKIEAQKVQLPTLNQGIYFVTILENNHVLKTQKIIVR